MIGALVARAEMAGQWLARGWQRRRRLGLGTGAVLLGVATTVVLVASARARLEAPAPTLLLRDRHGRFLGEVGGNDATGSGYWRLDELPSRVVAATLAVEDRRFWTHPGVDSRAVLRAAWQNLSHGSRVSGASTIAMQVARLQRPGRRTYLRKAVEAVTALFLTRRHRRQEILTHYLCIVPYGNQIHGIAYAARRYLDKPVEDLSWAEVAFLTAIPQAPARMNPFSAEGRRQAIARGRHILDALHADGLLSAAEHELAAAQIRTLRVPERGRRPDEAMHPVLALEATLAAPEHRAVLAGEPVVTTTLDLDLQREVSWLTLRALIEWQARGAGNAAVIVVDRATREVLAWVGSSDYFDRRHCGAIDYARAPRSPGSTLKPFIYALAIERGIIDPATVLDDLQRGAGGIGNADERFLGPLLPRVALANSRNVPAADLLATVGVDQGFDLLGELGLHDRAVSAHHYGLGLAIGGMPVTLEQLVRAYTVLAGDGCLGDLVWYRRQPCSRPRRVLSEDTVRQITAFLADPMARLPSFPRMGHLEYPFPVAVKTGTSSKYHDAWTVAYSRRYLVGCWVGHPDFRPMSRLSGYRSAARLVRAVLLYLHRDDRDGLEEVGFPPPRGFVAHRICALSGGLATPACDRVFRESFAPHQAPTVPCTAHLRLAVDRRNGLLATSRTPRQWLEVRTFTDLGPRYGEWQAAAGIPQPPRLASLIDAGPGARWSAPGGGQARPLPALPARISITAPEPELRLLRDPETPAELSTLALRAVVDPPCEQVVWYVDCEPFTLADRPYTARWPLAPGTHTFQARIPFTDARSSTVSVTVY